jgi:hypothetical protein
VKLIPAGRPHVVGGRRGVLRGGGDRRPGLRERNVLSDPDSGLSVPRIVSPSRGPPGGVTSGNEKDRVHGPVFHNIGAVSAAQDQSRQCSRVADGTRGPQVALPALPDPR